MQAVLILSVQHTGTWFAIELFRTHPNVGGFAQMRNLEALASGQPLPRGRDLSHNESLAPEGTIQLLHGHLFHNYVALREPYGCHLDTLMRIIPTIVPLRDPMLSVLARNNRYPEHYPHADLVASWVRLAELARTNPRLRFLRCDPVDVEHLRRLAVTVFGASAETSRWLEGAVDKVRRGEIYTNSRELYALKKEYQAGNWDFVRKAAPELWAGLHAATPTIRPFLEAHGYRDLPWWDPSLASDVPKTR